MGRKKMSADKKRAHDLRVPVNEKEKVIITAAAGDDGVAKWLRELALRAAKRKR